VPQRSKPGCNALEALNLTKDATTKPSEWEIGVGELYKGYEPFQSAKRGTPNRDIGYIYPLPTQLAVLCWKQFKTGSADIRPTLGVQSASQLQWLEKHVRVDRYRERTVRHQGADRPPYKLKHQSNWPRTVRRQKVFSNPQNTVLLEWSAERSASEEMNRGQSTTNGRTVRR
jgi:hypothetical protein